VTVVSGLARGIDTVAHAATLKAGGRTVAVIGSGLDVPYPPENRKLMELIDDEGAIVSEFPMGTKPDAPNFPRRNRIISGMTLGTIVIESGEDGGAMITASTALDQNREVFAVPGTIYEKKSAGPNLLIQRGQAKLVLTVADVVEELGRSLPKTGVAARTPVEPSLTLFERAVYEQLSSDPLHIDTIADRAATSTADALVTLLGLEFKGVVRQLPGKHFIRS
jgi:DNA processing protein